MSLATVLGMGMAWWWGWAPGAGLVFGLSLSCASTVVLIKALEARGILDSMNGRIAVAWLVVAIPDSIGLRQMVETARTLNPAIEVVLRTDSEDESQLLRRDLVGTVFFGEEELAKGMTSHVLQRFAPPPAAQPVS
jgi:predicted Kef-type K+ transport protein